MPDKYPALRYLLSNAERLFPEERQELVSLLGRVERLEAVHRDAEALVNALVDGGAS